MRIYFKSFLAAAAGIVALNAHSAPSSAVAKAPVSITPTSSAATVITPAEETTVGTAPYPQSIGQIVPRTVDGTMTPVNTPYGYSTGSAYGLAALENPLGRMNFGAPASPLNVPPITQPVQASGSVIVTGGPVVTTVPSGSVIVTGGQPATTVHAASVIAAGAPVAATVPAGSVIVTGGTVTTAPTTAAGSVIITGGTQ